MAYMDLEFPGDAQEARVRSGINISDVEKWISLAAGAGLTFYGVSRARRNGWLIAALGGMLLERGATGHCRLYEAFNVNTAGTKDDTRRALGGNAGSTSRKASSSIVPWKSSTGSGGISRTFRDSCDTWNRSSV